jgi:hypothetical protein
MKRLKFLLLLSTFPFFNLNCNQHSGHYDEPQKEEWRYEFSKELSLFGHRNWILIVDKAFPAQTGSGIRTIATGEDLPDVLSFVLQEIDHSTHVSPIVYTDKELSFITSDLVANIDAYRSELDEILGHYNPRVILHDSVFVKIDEASKLFKILVLKTEEVIAYSSVFIELDCRYWSA